MTDELMLIFGDDGIAREYKDDFDITIHCESKEEQDEVWKRLTQDDWIPCSEPPKNEGTYLVYAPGYMGGSSSAKENHNGVMFSNYKNGKWSIEHGYYERPNCVKAWRTLPEPWGGEQDGKM